MTFYPESRILDLGCGRNKQPGAFGVDKQGDQKDGEWDLEQTPWPFKPDRFLVVYALQVLEHLDNPVEVMQELYRVCAHGALVFIQVPNGTCPGYVQDPTHKHPWNLGAFIYFCPSQWPDDWDRPYRWFGTDFRILHYHTTGERPGRAPWGITLHADNLTVVLQVIKEPEEDEGGQGKA